MNTALLFFLLSLLFSALWVIEREARKDAEIELHAAKEAFERHMMLRFGPSTHQSERG